MRSTIKAVQTLWRGRGSCAHADRGVRSGLKRMELGDEGGALPPKALDDSLHIALFAVHGIDYLLTWNCRHIDNAETKPIVRSVCAAHGYSGPEICTPQELMGASENG